MADELGAPRKPRRSSIPQHVLSNGGQVGAMDTSHCEADDQIVFCVQVTDSGTQTSSAESRFQTNTFEMLENAGVDPEWISEENAMRISANDPNFFILPVFRGPVFEHLEKVGVKVVGSSLVQECLKLGVAMPKLAHPIFSSDMSKAVVCFTGLSIPVRKELTRTVQWMNGVVSKELLSSVTHLVTDRCIASSEKYKAACKAGIPVMSTKWIEDGWTRQKMDKTSLTSPQVIAKYKLPIFANTVICTSGVSGQDRCDMGRLIELHGGKCPGDMKKGECTHLVTDQTLGEKYRKARQWGSIQIVATRWIRKCVESGYLLNERHFDPAVAIARSSTQAPNGQAPADLDFSSIVGFGKNCTVNSQALLVASTGVDKVDKTATPVLSNKSRLLRRESGRRLNTTSSQFDPIDDLSDDCLRGDFDFLEGCLIWLCGVRDANLDKWKRLLNRCGATRVMSMDTATHVVVLSVGSYGSQLEEAKQRGVVIVRAQWIMQCVNKKQQVDYHEFVWDGKEVVTTRSSVVGATPRTSDFSLVCSTNTVAETTKAHSSGNSAVNGGPTTSSMVGATPRTSHFSLTHSSDTSAVNGGPTTETEKSTTASAQQNESGKLQTFSNKTFRFNLPCPELVSQWTKQLEDHGGVVLESGDSRLADYLISDYVEYGSLPSTRVLRYNQVVTQLWLQRCIAQSLILNIRDHPLFLPIPAVADSVVFKNVVVGFLQLDSQEKAVLMELVTKFGGRTESSIVSRPRNGILPCTHLVPALETPKVGDCRLKLPRMKVVDPSWIIESLINEKLFPEVNFPLQGTAYASYAGRTDDCWTVLVNGGDKENCPSTSALELDDASVITVEEGQSHQDNSFAHHNENVETDCVPVTSSISKESRYSDNPGRFNPRFNLKGITQILDAMPSPDPSPDTSNNSFTVSRIGRDLAEAVVRTGRRDGVEPSITQRVNMVPREAPAVNCATSQQMTIAKSDSSSKEDGAVLATVKAEDKPLAPRFNEEQKPAQVARALVQQELLSHLHSSTTGGSSRCDNRGSSDSRGGGRKRRLQLDLDETTRQAKRMPNSQEEVVIEWQSRPSEQSSPAVHVEAVVDEPGPTPVPPLFPRTSSAESHEQILSFDPRPAEAAVVAENEASLSTDLEGSMSMNTTKVFSFTAINNQAEREEMSAIIKSLGGVVSKNDKSDLLEDVTHLICGKLIRGTKLMGCIASGRWVLTPEYVLRSGESGSFLDESSFEWGDPSIISKKSLEGRELQIARSCRRWRLELASDLGRPMTFGAFSGWRVLLYASEEKATSLVPLIIAGHAKVVLRCALRDDELAQFEPTHAVVVESPAWNPKELQQLVSLNTRVFILSYVAKYLLEEGVNCEDFYHPDYKAVRRMLLKSK